MALIYKALALLLFSSAVTLGCVDRNVRVIFEGGDGAEFMLSGIPLRTFLMSGTECWKTSSVSIMDSAKVLIKDAFDLWSKIENGRTVRENVVEELNNILKANGDELHPRDNAPVIVLFLRDNDLNVKDLVAAARDLQETGYKFIVYGIGSKLSRAVFEPIAVASKRVLVAKDFESINENVLNILLKNPDHKFPKTASFSNDADTEKCENVIVDLGFILDSSGSLRRNYQQEKDFIKTIARGFNINKGGSHAGVVTFSHVAHLSIPFSQSDDLTTFENDVDKIRYEGGGTRIDLALEKARDELFNTAKGARPNVKKVLVLLTDGEQTQGNGARSPADIAKELRTKLGVELLVIGIGPKTNAGELKKITGPNDNFRKANSFTDLASSEFVRKMTKKVCTIVTRNTCHKLVDICFLIDSSGSIDEGTHWQKIKEFVRSLADRFSISATGSHGAVVVFSDHIKSNQAFTKTVLKLDNKMHASSFGQSVMNIPYLGYRTRMDLGFNLVEKEVFVSKNGARAIGVKKIVILITDGKQNPKRYDPVAASQKLYNDKVNIYAIGIGNTVDFNQLKRITRHPHRVFAARDFKSLSNEEFVKNVTETSCHKGETPIEKPTDGCCCGQDDLNKMKDELIKSFAELAAEKMKNKFCKRDCGEQAPPSVGIPSVVTNYYRTHKGTQKA